MVGWTASTTVAADGPAAAAAIEAGKDAACGRGNGGGDGGRRGSTATAGGVAATAAPRASGGALCQASYTSLRPARAILGCGWFTLNGGGSDGTGDVAFGATGAAGCGAALNCVVTLVVSFAGGAFTGTPSRIAYSFAGGAFTGRLPLGTAMCGLVSGPTYPLEQIKAADVMSSPPAPEL